MKIPTPEQIKECEQAAKELEKLTEKVRIKANLNRMIEVMKG